eukprot:Opistho-2@95411
MALAARPYSIVDGVTRYNSHVYAESLLRSRQAECASVFAQAYSQDGFFLAAARSDGRVCVWNIVALLEEGESGVDSRAPCTSFLIESTETAIYTLTTAYVDGHSLLFAGTSRGVLAYQWHAIIERARHVRFDGFLEPAVTLSTPTATQGGLQGTEVNAIVCDAASGRLYAAGGENVVQQWDIRTGHLTASYVGHKDYVHCLAQRFSRGQIVSGSEDGTVRFWDTRTGTCARSLSPALAINPSAKKATHYVSCVAVDSNGDWLACGGGFPVAVVHADSGSVVASSPRCVGTRDLCFHDNMILAGGGDRLVRKLDMDATVRGEIATSSAVVYSIKPNVNAATHAQVVTVAGTSNTVDVYLNLSYRSLTLLMS